MTVSASSALPQARRCGPSAQREGGVSASGLARAIHRQLPAGDGAVPVEDIALALDIVEVRHEHLWSFEGALITTEERGSGSIVVNSRSGERRGRFTLAHELLHFLNPRHVQTAQTGLECRKSDLILGGRTGGKVTANDRQEIEANTFAIELLAPEHRMRKFISRDADLEWVIKASNALDLSKEATARRYVQLHGKRLAVLFSKDGRLLYLDRGEDFPWLAIKPGDPLPQRVVPGGPETVSDMAEVDAESWLGRPTDAVMYAQTAFQADGRTITLLEIESALTD